MKRNRTQTIISRRHRQHGGTF